MRLRWSSARSWASTWAIGGLIALLGVVVGAWLDPEVRGAAAIGAAWMGAVLLLYLIRFRQADEHAQETRGH
jgi:hypothetical protein